MNISTALFSFSAAALCLWLVLFVTEVRAQPVPVHAVAASTAMAGTR
jgi:hypothetical protein